MLRRDLALSLLRATLTAGVHILTALCLFLLRISHKRKIEVETAAILQQLVG